SLLRIQRAVASRDYSLVAKGRKRQQRNHRRYGYQNRGPMLAIEATHQVPRRVVVNLDTRSGEVGLHVIGHFYRALVAVVPIEAERAFGDGTELCRYAAVQLMCG